MQKLVIRLRRKVTKTYTCYDIVLVRSQGRDKTAFNEKLGFVNPNRDRLECTINFQRLGFWLNRGATMRYSAKQYIGLFASNMK